MSFGYKSPIKSYEQFSHDCWFIQIFTKVSPDPVGNHCSVGQKYTIIVSTATMKIRLVSGP